MSATSRGPEVVLVSTSGLTGDGGGGDLTSPSSMDEVRFSGEHFLSRVPSSLEIMFRFRFDWTAGIASRDPQPRPPAALAPLESLDDELSSSLSSLELLLPVCDELPEAEVDDDDVDGEERSRFRLSDRHSASVLGERSLVDDPVFPSTSAQCFNAERVGIALCPQRLQ